MKIDPVFYRYIVYNIILNFKIKKKKKNYPCIDLFTKKIQIPDKVEIMISKPQYTDEEEIKKKKNQ